MTAAELISRAVEAARPFYMHSTGVEISPTICAALEADGIYDDDRGIFWVPIGCDWVSIGRDGFDTIPCVMNEHLPGTQAIVHCMNLDLWQGDLCRSAHERLAVEMKMKHFVNI